MFFETCACDLLPLFVPCLPTAHHCLWGVSAEQPVPVAMRALLCPHPAIEVRKLFGDSA